MVNVFEGREVEAKFVFEESSPDLDHLIEVAFGMIGVNIQSVDDVPLKRKQTFLREDNSVVRVTHKIKGGVNISTKGEEKRSGLYIFVRREEKDIDAEKIQTDALELIGDRVQKRRKIRFETGNAEYCFALAHNYKFSENPDWQSPLHVLQGKPDVRGEIEYKGSGINLCENEIIEELNLFSIALVHMLNDSGIRVAHKPTEPKPTTKNMPTTLRE